MCGAHLSMFCGNNWPVLGAFIYADAQLQALSQP